MPKQKSSATSATRKKHAAKKGEPSGAQSQSNHPIQAANGANPNTPLVKARTKKEKAALKNGPPRKKMYIAPVKPQAARPDPVDVAMEVAGTYARAVDVLDAEVVVSLRSLGKKSVVTRGRGVEEIGTWVRSRSKLKPDIEETDQNMDIQMELRESAETGMQLQTEMVLRVWMHHFPALLTHPSRRLRYLAAGVMNEVVKVPGALTLLEPTLSDYSDDMEYGGEGLQAHPDQLKRDVVGAWCLAAHDADRGVAGVAKEGWGVFVASLLPSEPASASELPKNANSQLVALALPSFLLQTLTDPGRVYAQIHGAPQSQGEGKEGREDDEGERDEERHARLRVGVLGALEWAVERGVPMRLPVETWDALSSTAESEMGVGQPGVRKAAWGLLGVVVRHQPKEDEEEEERVDAGYVLECAWAERDAGVWGVMWGVVLRVLNGGGNDIPSAWTPPTFDAFMGFLAAGAGGAYPAVVLVLNSVPGEILSTRLDALFTALWAPYERANMRAGEHPAFVAALWECVALVRRREMDAHDEQQLTKVLEALASGRLRVGAERVGEAMRRARVAVDETLVFGVTSEPQPDELAVRKPRMRAGDVAAFVKGLENEALKTAIWEGVVNMFGQGIAAGTENARWAAAVVEGMLAVFGREVGGVEELKVVVERHALVLLATAAPKLLPAVLRAVPEVWGVLVCAVRDKAKAELVGCLVELSGTPSTWAPPDASLDAVALAMLHRDEDMNTMKRVLASPRGVLTLDGWRCLLGDLAAMVGSEEKREAGVALLASVRREDVDVAGEVEDFGMTLFFLVHQHGYADVKHLLPSTVPSGVLERLRDMLVERDEVEVEEVVRLAGEAGFSVWTLLSPSPSPEEYGSQPWQRYWDAVTLACVRDRSGIDGLGWGNVLEGVVRYKVWLDSTSSSASADRTNAVIGYLLTHAPKIEVESVLRRLADSEGEVDALVLERILRHVFTTTEIPADLTKAWTARARALERQGTVRRSMVLAMMRAMAGAGGLERWRNEVAASIGVVGTSTQTQQTSEVVWAVRKLVAMAPSEASGEAFLASQRAVAVVKAVEGALSADDQDEDDAEELEGLLPALLLPLLPILQGVPGGHWAFVWDVLRGLEDSDDTLGLLRLVRTVSDLVRTNRALRTEWADARADVRRGVWGVLFVDGSSEEATLLALEILRDGDGVPPGEDEVEWNVFAKLLPLLAASTTIEVVRAAYPLLRLAAGRWTEHMVLDAALDVEGDSEREGEAKEEAREWIPESMWGLLAELDEDATPAALFTLLSAYSLLFALFEGASVRVRERYVDELRAKGIVAELMLFVEGVLGLDGTLGKGGWPGGGWGLDEFYIELFESSDEDEDDEPLRVLAAHVLRTALLRVPALIYSYTMDLRDRERAGRVREWVGRWVSPGLVRAEVDNVKGDATLQDDTFKIRVLPSNEIVATYLVDEHALEMRVRIPPEWPLGRMEVGMRPGVVRVGVDEERWRRWVLGVQQVVWRGNGRLADALALFKKNAELHFEGQVECAICYSIISVMDNTLPTRPCRTCKNRFHGGCLYKWFSTSHSSSCPLCRSDMV